MLLFSGERLLLDKVSLQLSIFVRDSVLKDKIKWTLHVVFPLPGFCYYTTYLITQYRHVETNMQENTIACRKQ